VGLDSYGRNGDVLHLEITRARPGTAARERAVDIEAVVGTSPFSMWWGYVAN